MAHREVGQIAPQNALRHVVNRAGEVDQVGPQVQHHRCLEASGVEILLVHHAPEDCPLGDQHP